MMPIGAGESGGGGSSGQIGKGGGQLVIKIGSAMTLDGAIEANGGNGVGGGSGGSLFIQGGELKGRGKFLAQGGAGDASNGGGGGGGRIAIFSSAAEGSFKGTYSVAGGAGYNKGQPGTVVFVTTAGVPKSTLYLREAGTVLLVQDTGLLYFDQTIIGASVDFQLRNVSFKTNSVQTSIGCSLAVSANASFIVNSTSRTEMKCDFDIKETGLVEFSSALRLDSLVSKTESIYGRLKAPSLLISPLKTVQIMDTGRLITDKLEIGRNVKLSLMRLSTVGNSTLKRFSLKELHLSMKSSIIFNSNKVAINADVFTMAQASSIKSVAELDLTIRASEISIENQVEITASGSKSTSVTSSSGNSTCGFGGSHGGQGGGAVTGRPYGSLVQPKNFGSTGGTAASILGAVGGGVITIYAKRINLNGAISTNGVSSSGNQGGGSGGSLIIRADTLSGHGTITSNGGSSLCGGGSGGRIALHVNYRTTYKGDITAYGGQGYYPGAGGTVFIAEKVVGIALNTTIVNNNGVNTKAVTNIIADSSLLSFQNLIISGQGRLSFSPKLRAISKPLVVKFIKVLGDLSGIMMMNANQTVYLQTSQAYSERPFMLPCSLMVKKDAILFLSTRLFITKTVNQPSLHIEGTVVGGENIIAGKQGQVVVARTGNIGIPTGQQRVYSFRSISILNQGKIKFESLLQEKVEVNSESISVGYGGILEGINLKLKTPLLSVAYNGKIIADGNGYPRDLGPGAGVSVASGGASGGSYGGFSGSGTIAKGRKSVYGSLYKAEVHGSGGGSSGANRGGSGGGIIELAVTRLRLDGTVSSKGTAGATNAGGGSGGSIHIMVTAVFDGLGSLLVLGGAGTGNGGGGSGGRISIHLNKEYLFKGVVDASGGASAGANSIMGSPGTIYIKDTYSGYFQREMLLLENRLPVTKTLESTLNQTVSQYVFDHFLLKGGLMLHVDKTTVISKLVSDDKSILHVPDHVVLTVEQTQKESNIQASFHVDKYGEIRLASKVTFRGLDNRLLGTLTGVFDFNIGETKATTLSLSGRTAHYKDGKYVFMSNRGEYKFIKVTLQNRAKLLFQGSSTRLVPLNLASLEMHYGSLITAPRLFIDAGDITIHVGAKIDVSGSIVNTSATGIQEGGSNCGYGGGRINDLSRDKLSSVLPNSTGEAGGGQSMAGK